MDSDDGRIAKKLQSQSSDDEETKNNKGLIVSTIFKKKINIENSQADKPENRGTISRFFSRA